MPLNILRLNAAPSSHPNDRIAFIRPLPRPAPLQADYAHADLFLRAIAAQCLPIMKTHHLSVTTLEEHEPNREFIGRNFNNGEVIQLVLRRRDGGGWMSFHHVQLVMMHELAHNLQMNHGKEFWVERNRFVGELTDLWKRGYTGDGFWGAGRGLEGLELHAGNSVDVGMGGEVEGLCGGTFRRERKRKRKRKRESGDEQEEEEEMKKKRKLTWKEQRDRRIDKKFGRNGLALGEDEDARIKLEIQARGPVGGKPRVAGSKRGRELRAAAALARLATRNVEEKATSDDEMDIQSDSEPQVWRARPALDILGGDCLLDSMGFHMVRVCGDDDVDDADVKKEMDDFKSLAIPPSSIRKETAASTADDREEATEVATSAENSNLSASNTEIDQERVRHRDQIQALCHIPRHHSHHSHHPPPPSPPSPSESCCPAVIASPATATSAPSSLSLSVPAPNIAMPSRRTAHVRITTCPICSTTNDSLHATCSTCSHVLDRRKDPRSWICARGECDGSQFVNAGDCGRCGGCGGRR